MKVDAAAVGFDAGRLARVEEHLRSQYVEAGKIAGCQIVVARRGRLALSSSIGSMDLERSKPVYDDTIWRLYSMTKPITGVALLSLYERGRFQLNDPVHRFLPEWRDVSVRQRDADGTVALVAPERPMTVRDLMMHMAGIGYGPRGARLSFDKLTAPPGRMLAPPAAGLNPEPVAERSTSSTPGVPGGMTLEQLSFRLAAEPLRFHPGKHWLYSWSTDMCARLVEVISGQPFDEYLRATIFDPLGMIDTGFSVPDADIDRFAACYARGADKQLRLVADPTTSA
jgi:CubicO group peptidase (beta-lactamase class C family)